MSSNMLNNLCSGKDFYYSSIYSDDIKEEKEFVSADDDSIPGTLE